jgi:hypothetical protein
MIIFGLGLECIGNNFAMFEMALVLKNVAGLYISHGRHKIEYHPLITAAQEAGCFFRHDIKSSGRNPILVNLNCVAVDQVKFQAAKAKHRQASSQN